MISPSRAREGDEGGLRGPNASPLFVAFFIAYPRIKVYKVILRQSAKSFAAGAISLTIESRMQWIAPSEKDTATESLEKRLWDAAAGNFRPNSGVTPQQYSGRRRIQNLRRTRDLLLPRLLSGKVELKTEAPGTHHLAVSPT